ncbi:MAG TPA: sugar phosphate nucleotidyltransferase, partial [Nitrospiria bacterium]|nr:sugar phosphate nucleotidyltransferase [Nitrospiria bacterium]
MKGIIFTEWGGINLSPLTSICSEPLFPLGDIPVIDYLLKRLKLSGIDEVLIVLNKRTEDLVRHLGDGIGTGIMIDYVCQSLPLGRGGAIREAADFLDNKPFLLVDSSAVIDFDLLNLINFHTERGSSLT